MLPEYPTVGPLGVLAGGLAPVIHRDHYLAPCAPLLLFCG